MAGFMGGFKETSKGMIIAIIGIIAAIILFVVILLVKLGGADFFGSGIKESYDSYNEFHEDAGIGFFPDTAPDSAKNFKYYHKDKDDDRIDIVSFDVDNTDMNALKKKYSSEFSELGEFDSVAELKTVEGDFTEKEGIQVLDDFLTGTVTDYKILRYGRNTRSSYDEWLGIITNKDTGKVIIFDINKRKSS